MTSFEVTNNNNNNNNNNSNMCIGCGLAIRDQYIYRVSPGDMQWHECCLKCVECGSRLAEENATCHVRHGKCFCKSCYDRLYATKCDRCAVPLRRDDVIMRCGGSVDRLRIYHSTCFVCYVCLRRLQPGDEYLLREQDGSLYCKEHASFFPTDNIYNFSQHQQQPVYYPSSTMSITPENSLASSSSSSFSPNNTATTASTSSSIIDSPTSTSFTTKFPHHLMSAAPTIPGTTLYDPMLPPAGAPYQEVPKQEQTELIDNNNTTTAAAAAATTTTTGNYCDDDDDHVSDDGDDVDESDSSMSGEEDNDEDDDNLIDKNNNENDKKNKKQRSKKSKHNNKANKLPLNSIQQQRFAPPFMPPHHHRSIMNHYGNNSGHHHHHHHSGKQPRIRTVLNERQLQMLKTCYAANPRPDAISKEQLVELTGLQPRVIRVWFQNKRCKDKKKSMLMRSDHPQQQQQQSMFNGNNNGLMPITPPMYAPSSMLPPMPGPSFTDHF